MAELDSRKERILRAMIVEYVALAEPVGSEMLASKYEFGVRSATIRNELAELAEHGYLEQPHTSAGRIPSDQGYRYYVDHMVVRHNPETPTRQQVKGAADDGDALGELLRGTTKVLSRLTQLLAAATILPDKRLVVRNAVVTALGPERLLLVIVLNNGHVENRLIECPKDVTLNEIGRANEILGHLVANHSVRALTRLKTPATTESPSLNRLLTGIVSAIRQIGRDLGKANLILEGEEFILSQPELRRNLAVFEQLIDSLQDEESIVAALASPVDAEQTVTIGKEHPTEKLQPFSIVKQSFFVGEDEAGTLAVIGPTRMNYDSSISLLDFTAKAISETLTKLMK